MVDEKDELALKEIPDSLPPLGLRATQFTSRLKRKYVHVYIHMYVAGWPEQGGQSRVTNSSSQNIPKREKGTK
jgi:hypothetical protein